MEVKLDNIFLKSERIHTFVGPSDAGKSKLLYYIMKNYSNQAVLYIQNVNDFFLMKTVKEELKFSILEKSYQNDIIIKTLNSVGMKEEYLDKKISKLSLSEKCKIELASILLQDKELILLDDPTVYLDKKEINNLIKLLKQLKKDGKTIVIATQNLEFALEVCDDICLYHHDIIYFDEKYEAMKNMVLFEKENLSIPPTLSFTNKVKSKKNISIGYRLDINDLIKDIYRNVT